jgi:hypothetical protein
MGLQAWLAGVVSRNGINADRVRRSTNPWFPRRDGVAAANLFSLRFPLFPPIVRVSPWYGVCP